MAEIKGLRGLLKSGEITAESQRVGGVLRPQQASRIIDLMVETDDFLGKVTVERSSRLQKDVDVYEIAQEVLVRVPEGEEPADFAQITNEGCTLNMLPAQLFGRVLFSSLRDNQDNPQFESQLLKKWSARFAENVVRLGFVGTSDTYASRKFTELNKGWVQLLKDAGGKTHTVDAAAYVQSGATDWPEYLGAVIEALPDRYKSAKCKIVMNISDHEALIRQIGRRDGMGAVLLEGKLKEMLGYDIERVGAMPRGTVIFTPLENLIYGACTQIERYRELNGKGRCIDYTFDMPFDYQVAIPDAAAIGYAAG